MVCHSVEGNAVIKNGNLYRKMISNFGGNLGGGSVRLRLEAINVQANQGRGTGQGGCHAKILAPGPEHGIQIHYSLHLILFGELERDGHVLATMIMHVHLGSRHDPSLPTMIEAICAQLLQQATCEL